MQVFATLYTTRKGIPAVWEFVKTGSGSYIYTDGKRFNRCRNYKELRQTYEKYLTYTRKDGKLTFSKQPIAV